MCEKAFSPVGSNLPVAASTTSAGGSLPGVSDQLRVYNSATGVAFWRVGNGAQTAVATDTFVAPGATEVFSIPPLIDNFAVILSTGTGTVYAQRGYGL